MLKFRSSIDLLNYFSSILVGGGGEFGEFWQRFSNLETKKFMVSTFFLEVASFRSSKFGTDVILLL